MSYKKYDDPGEIYSETDGLVANEVKKSLYGEITESEGYSQDYRSR